MRVLLYIVCVVISLASCKKEYSEVSDSLPKIALERTEGTIRFSDTFRLRIILNKEVSEDFLVPYKLQSDLEQGIDYEWVDSLFYLPKGAIEDEITLVLFPNETNAGAEWEISLQGSTSYHLIAERSRGVFFVGPGHTADISIWAPNIPFPQLWGVDNAPGQNTGPGNGRHFCFSYASKTEQNIIGLYNLDSTRSTNALNMHRIYADQDVSSSSARIRIERAIRFTPDREGAKEGTVTIIPQKVKIYRKSSSSLSPYFYIGIQGFGTYSERTQEIDLTVLFDESDIGGESEVLRKYILTPNEP